MTLCWSLDKLGPMARSVEDVIWCSRRSRERTRAISQRLGTSRVRRGGKRRRAARRLLPRWMQEDPATEVDRQCSISSRRSASSRSRSPFRLAV